MVILSANRYGVTAARFRLVLANKVEAVLGSVDIYRSAMIVVTMFHVAR